jgi:hypothetical protein
MLSLTVRQVIQSGSCLVNGSVFSVIEVYEWMVLLCEIFDFHHVVSFVFDTKDLYCTFSVIKRELHNNFCKRVTLSVKIAFQIYIDALWHLVKIKLCYLEGSPIESEINPFRSYTGRRPTV